MANARTIAQVLAEISILYPMLFEVTDERGAIWTLYLRDMDDALLLAALKHYVATAKDNYPPSVPALRKAAADLKRRAAGIPSAFEAWKELVDMPADQKRPATDAEREEILRRGEPEQDADGRTISYQVVCHWTHPLVAHVAQQMGWPKFPGMENVETDRAHFFRAYEDALSRLMEQDRELPEVIAYIERAKQPALPGVGELVKKLESK